MWHETNNRKERKMRLQCKTLSYFDNFIVAIDSKVSIRCNRLKKKYLKKPMLASLNKEYSLTYKSAKTKVKSWPIVLQHNDQLSSEKKFCDEQLEYFLKHIEILQTNTLRIIFHSVTFFSSPITHAYLICHLENEML